MNKLKTLIASLLRKVADKMDPPQVVVQGGGGHGEE